MSGNGGWIGVDLDGTLAHYEGWKGEGHIGEPVRPMLLRVQKWLLDGREVRIFTARAYPWVIVTTDGYATLLPSHMKEDGTPDERAEQAWRAIEMITAWCLEHFGARLTITCMKDFGMVELWDDRCVQVIPNTGRPLVEPQ